MKNFYTALMTYFNALSGGSHNAFYTDIGGRLYNTYAPEGATLPYAVFQHISSRPADTFTETMDEILLQFSIFSASPSSSEVLTAMDDLKSLFDNCAFAVEEATIVRFSRGGEGLTSEIYETVDGLQRGWHYYVEYEVLLQAIDILVLESGAALLTESGAALLTESGDRIVGEWM